MDSHVVNEKLINRPTIARGRRMGSRTEQAV